MQYKAHTAALRKSGLSEHLRLTVKETVVGDDNECVHALLQCLNGCLCLQPTAGLAAWPTLSHCRHRYVLGR